MEIRVLRKGDKVLGVSDDQIVIQRKNGSVDIFKIVRDEDGLPRLDNQNVCTITYGSGTVHVMNGSPQPRIPRRGKRKPAVKDNDVEVIKF
jgi:hypothetical protein